MKTKIIALSGFARVGKDSIAEKLTEKIRNDLPHINVHQQSLADKIKQDLRPVAQIHEIDPYTEDDEQKAAFRHLMMGYGSFCRALYGQDYFVQQLMEYLDPKVNLLIIPDCRKHKEVKCLSSMGGKIIGLCREGVVGANDDESDVIPLIIGKADHVFHIKTRQTKEEVDIESMEIAEKIFNKIVKYIVK